MIGTYLCICTFYSFFFHCSFEHTQKNDDTLILEQVQKKNYVLTMEDEQMNE